MVDAVVVLTAFNGDAHPDVFGPWQVFIEQRQLLGPLGQNLVDMPACPVHDIKNLHDEGLGSMDMEQVAHGVHENHLRLFPAERQIDRVRVDSQLEAVAVVGRAHGMKPAGHSFGIAVPASGADFRAAGDGVPGAFGPFNGGIQGHLFPLIARNYNLNSANTPCQNKFALAEISHPAILSTSRTCLDP